MTHPHAELRERFAELTQCGKCRELYSNIHAACPVCARRKADAATERFNAKMRAAMAGQWRPNPCREQYDGQLADAAEGRAQRREHERAMRDAAEKSGGGSFDRPTRRLT